MRPLFAALLICLTSACASVPQAVVISPTISAGTSSIGRGISIELIVVDERPRQILGTRGFAGYGEDLTVEGDLVAIISGALTEGLKRQGFTQTTAGLEVRKLRVEIRNLDYSLSQGLLANSLNVNAGLKAICLQGLLRPYERFYRGDVRESVQSAQSSEANNRHVSRAVSAAVNSLLADEQLTACLAG